MELVGMFVTKTNAEGVAEKRFGNWFQRKLHLSTSQVISAVFATFDWLSDGGLAYDTWQNAGGSYTPTASEQLSCYAFLLEQSSMALTAGNGTELVWDGGSVAVDPAIAAAMWNASSCGATHSMVLSDVIRAECSRERAVPTAGWVMVFLVGGGVVGLLSDCLKTAVQVAIGAKTQERTAPGTPPEFQATENPVAATADDHDTTAHDTPALDNNDRNDLKVTEDEYARRHGRIGAWGLILEDVP